MGEVVLSETDAWVFMAIGGSPLRRDRLADVVFGLDYLNRTMPTEAEFVASVQRLGAAGFINVSSKGFKQTRAGRAVLKKWGPGIGVITVMLELMKEWDGLSIPPADAKFGFQLKPGEWQRAQEEHQAGLAKRMAKFTK